MRHGGAFSRWSRPWSRKRNTLSSCRGRALPSPFPFPPRRYGSREKRSSPRSRTATSPLNTLKERTPRLPAFGLPREVIAHPFDAKKAVVRTDHGLYVIDTERLSIVQIAGGLPAGQADGSAELTAV